MNNTFFDDISVLGVIERLKFSELLHGEDFNSLKNRLQTQWARDTADLLAQGAELPIESDQLLSRFLAVGRPPRRNLCQAEAQA